MATTTTVTIVSNDDMSQVRKDTQSPQESVVSLAQYLHKLAAGGGAASVDMQVNQVGGVAASGTLTLSSLANNDTLTVGTVVFTAKTSGATGNAQFNLGADDTAAAAAAVVKINAHPSLAGVVTATSALGVITVTAANKGLAGNMIALAASAHATPSGATLSGGVAPTSFVMHLGL